jgi:hypothetical protein
MFLFIGCQSLVKNKLVVVELTTRIDTQLYEGQPNFKLVNAVKIISFQDMNAYLIRMPRDRNIYELQTKTGEIIEKPTTYDTVVVCYIIKKNAQKGLKFDSLNVAMGRKFDIDTLNESINLGKKNRSVFMLDGDKLVYSLRDNKTGKLLIEKYSQHKINEADSIYRYYDYKMRDIECSISPFLDEKEKSKLVKIVYITNPKLNGGFLKNRGETSITLTPSSYGNSTQLLRLFEIFKKESERLKLD